MMTRPSRDAISTYLIEAFPKFGYSKHKELVALIDEIIAITGRTIPDIIPSESLIQRNFPILKRHLLALRFPHLREHERPKATYFHSEETAGGRMAPAVTPAAWQPKNIFVEHDVWGCDLHCRLAERFPAARITEISRRKEAIATIHLGPESYNERLATVFIIKERIDFFAGCPCSAGSQSCGYHIMNAGVGCGFDCAYCFLQGYLNTPGITFPGNLEDFFKAFKQKHFPGMRLGTGQFTDSLIFDEATGFSERLVEFFSGYPNVFFEFKTKSRMIDRLLAVPAAPNIVISWSLNPDTIINQVEFGTAALEERLAAAADCARHGYSIGFHFDPIIWYKGWEGDYANVVDEIFKAVPASQIQWISLGCLRMTRHLRECIRQRFPDNRILHAEQVIDFDGKIRYPERIRREIYRFMITQIHTISTEIPVYLCMDDPGLSRALGLPSPGFRSPKEAQRG